MTFAKDTSTDMVTVQKGAFLFCRIGTTLLLWSAAIFHSLIFLVSVFILLALSALLTVKYAPLIFFYEMTIGKIFPSQKEILDRKAMRFAHGLGTVFSVICLMAVLVEPNIGWLMTAIFAGIKTISMFGFCPATRLYKCVQSGGCCRFRKR